MDDDDSICDESSKGRSSRYSDNSSSTKGDTPSPSEPVSLLKLVSSRRPDVDNARNLLSDLTPDGITEELNATDSRGNRPIHYACIKGLVPWLELIIEQGGDVEVKGAGGRKPIHLVVGEKARSETQAQDKVKMIELLASKSVLVNEKDDLGQTPLQLACNHSEYRGQKMVIQALLLQSDVDEPVKVGGVNSTLLNIACHNNHFETALLLLDHGANPLAEDGSKNTPLFIILTKKNVEYALRFLTTCEDKGYDMRQILSVKNVYGRTALHQAIKIGHDPLIEYCLPLLASDDEMDGPEYHAYLLDFKTKYGTNVMHTACRKGHLDLAIKFHDLCPKLLYEKTNITGLTPLHYACSENYPELVTKICSIQRTLQLSIDDRDVVDGSPSLLKFTALRGSSDCLVVLLKHVEDQSTIMKLLEWISAVKNLSKVLKEFLNKFDYITMGNPNDDDIERITLLCAREGQTESLEQFFAWCKDAFQFEDDQNNNLMHLIAQGGHLDTAKAMLKKDSVDFKTWGRSNPNSTRNKLGQTPLHLAIKGGHGELTKLFLKADKSLAGEKDDSKVTPLMYACQRGDLFNVDLILEQNQDEIKFFDCDDNGLSCLDHAINNGHGRVAVKLLSQKDWRKLLTHSTNEAGTKTTPMRKLIETMPGVGKFVLDKCITRLSDTNTASGNCKIKVDYELLEDWFSPWMEDDSLWNTRGMSLDTMARRGFDMILHTFCQAASVDTSKQVSTNFQDDGTLKDGARINVTDAVYRALYHPLRLMIKTDESKELLNHPVVRLFLRQKEKATRLIYWFNFFIMLTLLILVTGHSLFIPPPFYVQAAGNGSNYTWLADGQTKWKDNLNPIAPVFFGKFGTWIIFILTVIYLLLFFYRVQMYKHSKLSSIRGLFSILREISLQVFTILFILPGFSNLQYHDVTLKAEWQWKLGACAVLLAWYNFILSLQTIPFFGIYVHLFIEVLATLLYFIWVAAIFIFSFAVVFCILLSNQVPFHTLGDSLGKVLAMTTGEIDYSGVFHNLDYLYKPDSSEDFTRLVFYPIPTRILFVIFIIFMPILIMNLLTGLAVYDIEVIQTKAKMHKRTLEAGAILDVQDNMFMFLWKSSVIKSQVIPVWTRISPWSKLLYKLTDYKEIHDQLVGFLEDLERTEDESVEFIKTTEMKIEDMAEKINDISRRLMGLSENVIDIKTQLDEAVTSIQELIRSKNSDTV